MNCSFLRIDNKERFMKDKVSIKVGSLIMYYFLKDRVDLNNPLHDRFTDLMSNCSPETWGDCISADPAAIDDWIEVVDKELDVNELSSIDEFQAIIYFLQLHTDEFGFNLQWLIDQIKFDYQNMSKWDIKFKELGEYILENAQEGGFFYKMLQE